MGFRPEVGEKLNLNKDVYRFEKQPAVIGKKMPYGQTGRQGTVRQLQHESGMDRSALKVFKERKHEGKQQLAIVKPRSS